MIWNYVATIWGVHRVGREALRLRPAVEDPMLGLRPLGSLSLGATFYYFGALAIIIAEVTLSPDPVRPAYLAFLVVLILFGAGSRSSRSSRPIGSCWGRSVALSIPRVQGQAMSMRR